MNTLIYKVYQLPSTKWKHQLLEAKLEALSFAKDQLYDKSARPDIAKALIVLLSKKSEDTVDHAVKSLKNAGVNIYTVAIGGDSNPLEMSDMASNVQNTFVSDDTRLDSLVRKMIPKLCEGRGCFKLT